MEESRAWSDEKIFRNYISSEDDEKVNEFFDKIMKLCKKQGNHYDLMIGYRYRNRPFLFSGMPEMLRYYADVTVKDVTIVFRSVNAMDFEKKVIHLENLSFFNITETLERQIADSRKKHEEKLREAEPVLDTMADETTLKLGERFTEVNLGDGQSLDKISFEETDLSDIDENDVGKMMSTWHDSISSDLNIIDPKENTICL